MNAPITLLQHRPMGVILATGADALSFLQGQLSADLHELTSERALLACCNSAQGRVQAVLWIVQRTDGIALITPSTLLDSLMARLRKYVLRAKLTLKALPDAVSESETTAAPAPWQHIESNGVSELCLPGAVPRWLRITLDKPGSGVDVLADIRAGLPQIYPETHEAFVAQMLNLDVLGGVSFSKGCYTGQEIIARTHYRGSIKRRMFRFAMSCPPPIPGTRVLADGEHAGEVVDAAATEHGCELLAVISLAQLEKPLQLETDASAGLEKLELPYAL